MLFSFLYEYSVRCSLFLPWADNLAFWWFITPEEPFRETNLYTKMCFDSFASFRAAPTSKVNGMQDQAVGSFLVKGTVTCVNEAVDVLPKGKRASKYSMHNCGTDDHRIVIH